MKILTLISIPVLFVLGGLLHFAYDKSNNNKIIGMFTPVNESIFEHTKLALTPIILFWSIAFLFIKDEININAYFLAMLISIIFSVISVISFYYTYVGVLGKNKEILNILDLLVSILIGQSASLHFYNYINGVHFMISILITILIVIVFVYLTFKPFKMPLFLDPKSKTYGINKKQ